MVDGILRRSLPVYQGDNAGDGEELGCVIVSLKDRIAELQQYLKNSI